MRLLHWLRPGHHLRDADQLALTSALANAQRTPRSLWERTTDDHRRMRLLHWLRPGHHLREADQLALIFGLRLRPDQLHRLDPLPHQLGARGEDSAVVFHLLGVPAD